MTTKSKPGLTVLNQKDLTVFLRDMEERIRVRAERDALASPVAKKIAKELAALNRKLSPLQEKADALRERLRDEFNLSIDDEGELSGYARYGRSAATRVLIDRFEALKSELSEARILGERDRVQAIVKQISALGRGK